MTIGSRQKIRSTDDEIIIKINENEVNRVDSVKSLGVHIYILIITLFGQHILIKFQRKLLQQLVP